VVGGLTPSPPRLPPNNTPIQPARQAGLSIENVTVKSGLDTTSPVAGQRDGKLYTLPPDTRSIEVAPPGEYRLRATGEVVCNPDYTVTFSISRPA
jgi:hypothetical protein